VIGFSIITSQFASSSCDATSACEIVGVATTAQSIDAQVLADFGSDRIVRLHESDDVDFRHLGQHARVEPAEVAGAGDADADAIAHRSPRGMRDE